MSLNVNYVASYALMMLIKDELIRPIASRVFEGMGLRLDTPWSRRGRRFALSVLSPVLPGHTCHMCTF